MLLVRERTKSFLPHLNWLRGYFQRTNVNGQIVPRHQRAEWSYCFLSHLRIPMWSWILVVLIITLFFIEERVLKTGSILCLTTVWLVHIHYSSIRHFYSQYKSLVNAVVEHWTICMSLHPRHMECCNTLHLIWAIASTSLITQGIASCTTLNIF